MDVVLENVTKRFADPQGQAQTVLEGLSLRCASGSATVLEGPSGSGKSTLLNLISGLLQPDEGAVLVGGTRIDTLPEPRRDRFRAANVGYIFQTFNLLSPLSALENLFLPAALAGSPLASARARATAILTSLGMQAHLHKRPFELSVGQRQRVAVARALLQRPPLLLADEPTASLDPEAAAAVIDAIARLHAEGTTVIVATHDRDVRHALAAEVVRVGKVRSAPVGEAEPSSPSSAAGDAPAEAR